MKNLNKALYAVAAVGVLTVGYAGVKAGKILAKKWKKNDKVTPAKESEQDIQDAEFKEDSVKDQAK